MPWSPFQRDGLLDREHFEEVGPSTLRGESLGSILSAGVVPLAVIVGDSGSNTLTGGADDDQIKGLGGADSLSGLAGNDTLWGGKGDDSLDGGAGDDTIDGGKGSDTVSYATATSAVVVNLATGTANGGTPRPLTAADITNPATQAYWDPADGGNGHIYELVQIPDGSIVWTQALALAEGARLSGASGYLATVTSAAEDQFILSNLDSAQWTYHVAIGGSDAAQEGVWRWVSGPEAGQLIDYQDWGAGEPNNLGDQDYLTYFGQDFPTYLGKWDDYWDYNQDPPGLYGYIVEYSGPALTPEQDTLKSIENVVGSALNDTISGDSVANRLDGGDGDDLISGGKGDDVIVGGDGVDTASYAGASGSVTVLLATGVSSGADGADSLSGIENIIGSKFADTLSGYQGANLLQGGAGDDVLSGFGGDDTLDGGKGADILIGGAGADTLTGGPSMDIFRYLVLADSCPSNRDLITDMTTVDVLDLSALDADSITPGDQAFHKVDAFTHHAGEMTLTFDAGANQTLLALDVNGDGDSDFELLMAGQHLDPTGWWL